MPPLLDGPPEVPLPRMSKSGVWNGEIWLKYPLNDGLVPVHYGVAHKALTELRVVIHDLASELFGKASDITHGRKITTIEAFWNRLQSWYHNLPEELGPKVIIFPWQLKIQ